MSTATLTNYSTYNNHSDVIPSSVDEALYFTVTRLSSTAYRKAIDTPINDPHMRVDELSLDRALPCPVMCCPNLDSSMVHRAIHIDAVDVSSLCVDYLAPSWVVATAYVVAPIFGTMTLVSPRQSTLYIHLITPVGYIKSFTGTKDDADYLPPCTVLLHMTEALVRCVKLVGYQQVVLFGSVHEAVLPWFRFLVQTMDEAVCRSRHSRNSTEEETEPLSAITNYWDSDVTLETKRGFTAFVMGKSPIISFKRPSSSLPSSTV